MKCDLVLCGVGGQGVLSLAGLLGEAARRQGLEVRQGEIHGMSQRGGAVQATLRLADGPIASPRAPAGCVDLLLALEPLEALRNVHHLSPDAWVVVAEEPFENLARYPDPTELYRRLDALPRVRRVAASALARKAGSARAANVVVLGAALDLLPVAEEGLEAVLEEHFARRGTRAVEANLRALAAGREAVGGEAAEPAFPAGG
jgi:indolepyruvate ferredoxin oxidoreductase beta subunit